MTDDDPRCCGTGTCLINADGLCWCGQQWDGEKMGFAALPSAAVKVSQAFENLPDAEKKAR